MRQLILARHADALAADAPGDDHQRALTARGREQAENAGTWLATQCAQIDCMLVSTAVRAIETADRIAARLDVAQRFEDEAIYGATPGELIRRIDAESASSILLVGHNPGVEQLVALLASGQTGEFRGMPPAAVAWLRLDGPLEPGAAVLHAFWSP